MRKINKIMAALLTAMILCTGMSLAEGEGVQAAEDIEIAQELSLYSRGNQVEDLQRRLTTLGFMTGALDGIYGNDTYQAVREAEAYVRLMEQRDSEAAAAQATAAPTNVPVFIVELTYDEQGNPVPAVTTAATATPAPAPTPATQVDGVADLALQWVLYNPEADFYIEDVSLGSDGATAIRVQRRLITLNYLDDAADGVFGINSDTALKAFQAAHGLEETGVADKATQAILFSDNAKVSKKPVYNQLSIGSSGNVVTQAQKQLIILGFMNGSASGYYDQRTAEGVMALEKYLFLVDHPDLTPKTTASPGDDADALQDNASTLSERIAVDAEDNPYAVLPEAESAADAMGFEATGVMTDALTRRFLEDGIPVYTDALNQGDTGDDVLRLQRRLYSLGYLTASGVDGKFGSGTRRAVVQFQGRNDLEKTGAADQAMQSILYSDAAVKGVKPYQIKVSTAEQKVFIYGVDDFDNYTVLLYTFICSTGRNDTPTPTGTFTNTGRGARWHYFTKFECWAQYAWYIDDDIMFHSVLYDEQDENTLRRGSVSALGSKASHGCVRLKVEDARWIWDNCAAGTTVVVY